MRKLELFMHISLDGFAAGPHGEMDWIHVDEEIFDFVADRINAVDTALYGRVTFEMMEGYWPTAADQPEATKHDIEHAAWYSQVAKVVLSRTLSGEALRNTQIISGNLADQIGQLKQGPGREIVIFGSPGAAHSLMAEKLIDRYWLFINPVLLGEGIPVFKNIQAQSALKLVASHAFTSGVVCLHYEIVRDDV